MALLFKPHVTENPARSFWDQLDFSATSGLLRWRYQGQFVGQNMNGPAIHSAFDQISLLKNQYLCVSLDNPPYGLEPAHDAATRLNTSSYRPNLSTPTVHFGWLNKFGHFIGCAFEHQDHFLRHTMSLSAQEVAQDGWIKITPQTWDISTRDMLPTQPQRMTLKTLGFTTAGRNRSFLPCNLEEIICQDPPMASVTGLGGITIRTIQGFGDIKIDGIKPAILSATHTAARLASAIASHPDNFMRQQQARPTAVDRRHLRLVVNS